MIVLRKIAVIGLVLTAAATSCGRNHNSAAEVTDTNTNWLESCDLDGQCGGLTCICGRCSRACEGDEDCARFGEAAVCAELSGSTCEQQTACVSRGETSGALATGTTCTNCETSSASAGSSERNASATGESTGGNESRSEQSSATSTQNTASTAEVGSSAGETVNQTTAFDSTTTDECDEAVEGQQCDTEGASCGECTDVCQFCNLLRCDGGTWQRLEAFPAPCVECGEGLECNALDTYCHVTDGATYSCEAYPEACSADHSCACLETETGGVCSGTAPELTVATGTSVVDQCACTVWLSGSGWCADIQGPNGEAFDVEWTCDPQTEIYASLNTECEIMPTGAARWCCPSSFAPSCQ